MRNALVIAGRDLAAYFASPLFYIVTAVFLVIQSFMFFNILNLFSYQSYQVDRLRQMGLTLNINELVIEPSLLNMGVILLLIAPLITMRSFAEERRNKSLPLLLSSPVSLGEIVMGKFLACVAVVGLMVLLSSYNIGLVMAVGDPETGPIVTGYLGLLLMVGCYISIGIFASSLTDNQLVAAMISFGFVFMMWIIGWAAQAAGPTTGRVLEHLSLVNHLQNFTRGVIETADLVYYLSFMAFMLFLTYHILDSRRWR